MCVAGLNNRFSGGRQKETSSLNVPIIGFRIVEIQKQKQEVTSLDVVRQVIHT